MPPACGEIFWIKYPFPFLEYYYTVAEQLFSTAGNLSDANQDPHYLAILTSVVKNKKVYNPKIPVIHDKYFQKFRGKGGEAGPSNSGGDGGSGEP